MVSRLKSKTVKLYGAFPVTRKDLISKDIIGWFLGRCDWNFMWLIQKTFWRPGVWFIFIFIFTTRVNIDLLNALELSCGKLPPGSNVDLSSIKCYPFTRQYFNGNYLRIWVYDVNQSRDLMPNDGTWLWPPPPPSPWKHKNNHISENCHQNLGTSLIYAAIVTMRFNLKTPINLQ